MTESGLMLGGGKDDANTTFYVLRDGSYVERVGGFVGRPELYSRVGEVVYEAQPQLNYIYRHLWRMHKFRNGYTQFPWDRDAVYKVKCSGKWWGAEVFWHLRTDLSGNCIAIVRESNEVVSIVVSSNGKLIAYACESDFAEKFVSLCASYPDYDLKFFGLDELELPKKYEFSMIKADCSGYQSLEEAIAHRILTAKRAGRSAVPTSVRYCGVGLCLCLTVSIGSWISIYHELGAQLEQLEAQMEQVRTHPLYNVDLPKNAPWSRLLMLLLSNAEMYAAQISGNGIRVYAQQQQVAYRTLRELGFAVVMQYTTDLLQTRQEHLDATYTDRDK